MYSSCFTLELKSSPPSPYSIPIRTLLTTPGTSGRHTAARNLKPKPSTAVSCNSPEVPETPKSPKTKTGKQKNKKQQQHEPLILRGSKGILSTQNRFNSLISLGDCATASFSVKLCWAEIYRVILGSRKTLSPKPN